MPKDLSIEQNHTGFTILVTAGYEDSLTRDHAMDFALGAAAFGFETMLIFQEAGLTHLLQPRKQADRFTKYLSQLVLFDLAPIYVCSESLSAYNLTLADFTPLPVEAMDRKSIRFATRPPKHCLVF